MIRWLTHTIPPVVHVVFLADGVLPIVEILYALTACQQTLSKLTTGAVLGADL